jgi:hypothetical protein
MITVSDLVAMFSKVYSCMLIRSSEPPAKVEEECIIEGTRRVGAIHCVYRLIDETYVTVTILNAYIHKGTVSNCITVCVSVNI